MSEVKKWLQRLDLIIDKQLKDNTLSNEELAQKLSISNRQLFRKVKTLSGLTPQKYLRQYRLKQAMRHLKNGRYRTVKETAFAVGFKNVSYFIQKFEKHFGKKPLQILRESGWR